MLPLARAQNTDRAKRQHWTGTTTKPVPGQPSRFPRRPAHASEIHATLADNAHNGPRSPNRDALGLAPAGPDGDKPSGPATLQRTDQRRAARPTSPGGNPSAAPPYLPQGPHLFRRPPPVVGRTIPPAPSQEPTALPGPLTFLLQGSAEFLGIPANHRRIDPCGWIKQSRDPVARGAIPAHSPPDPVAREVLAELIEDLINNIFTRVHWGRPRHW